MSDTKDDFTKEGLEQEAREAQMSERDKLWENRPASIIYDLAPDGYDWLLEWKEENDKLQRRVDEMHLTDSVRVSEVEYMDLMAKVEKWNIVVSMFDRDTVGKYHSVVHAIKNEHKLEAIQKIIDDCYEKGYPTMAETLVMRIKGVLGE